MSNESQVKTQSLKVVFDTNVYISAFLKSGFSRELFNFALSGKIGLSISQEILEELKEKLSKKFKVSDSDIELFIRTILQIAKLVSPSQKLKIIKNDPKDNIVLECAQEARANLIVSSDRHLLKLKRYQRIGIVHPKTLSWIIPDIFGK